jgi:hypothetical protein
MVKQQTTALKLNQKTPHFRVLSLYPLPNKPPQALNNADFNKALLKYTVKNTVKLITLLNFLGSICAKLI